MLQILKSFLENIGEGKLVLKKKRKTVRFNATDTGRESTVAHVTTTGTHRDS